MGRLLKITSLLIVATMVASAQSTLPFAMFHGTPLAGGLVRKSQGSRFVTAATNTISVTIPSKENLLLVVKVHWAWTLLSDVTFNGTSITQLAYRSNGGYGATIYYLIAPDVGTYDLVSTTNVSGDCLLAYEVYSGVDQTTPFEDDFNYWEGSTNPISNSMATAVGDSIIDAATFDRSSGQTATVYTGQAQFYNNTTSGDMGCVSSHRTPSGTTETMRWDLSANATWVHVAAAIRKAP